ncbi:MAG: Ig-like domain-containing protein, partial [Lachnospiraceae bacterium]|nr:Ig-like domain-containing protein [Lachnospiraceae bacterium]
MKKRCLGMLLAAVVALTSMDVGGLMVKAAEVAETEIAGTEADGAEAVPQEIPILEIGRQEGYMGQMPVVTASGGQVHKPLPKLTGNKRIDAANIAYSQIGYTESYYDANGNYSSSGNYNAYGPKAEWCVYFARWCAMQAGLDSSKWLNTGSTNALIAWFQQQGRWHNRDRNKWSLSSRGSYSDGTDDGYIPEVGDFAAIENGKSDGDTSANNAPDHTGIVHSVDSNYICLVEGNVGDKVVYRKYNRSNLRYSSSVYIVGFGEPDYGTGGSSQPTTNRLPIGSSDSLGGGEGCLFVGGWAYDPDSSRSASVTIKISVGGPEGTGSTYTITTNQSRPDVVQVHPNAPDNCGFDHIVKVNERGNQPVYIYAVDAQDASKSTLLASKTVMIYDVPFSIDFGQKSLSVKTGEFINFPCSFTGDGIHHLSYFFSDFSVANMKGLTEIDWTKGTCKIQMQGVKAGATTLTIYLMDTNDNQLYSKSIPVTVIQPVTGVGLNKTSLSLKAGSTGKLTATVSPSDASNKSINWSSSNTSVATVSSNGTVTAKAAGTATITAAAADGFGKKASCSVTVQKPDIKVTGISLNRTTAQLTLATASTIQLSATVTPSNATNKNINWSSSNTSVATVSSKGTVTAKAAGTA